MPKISQKSTRGICKSQKQQKRKSTRSTNGSSVREIRTRKKEPLDTFLQRPSSQTSPPNNEQNDRQLKEEMITVMRRYNELQATIIDHIIEYRQFFGGHSTREEEQHAEKIKLLRKSIELKETLLVALERQLESTNAKEE